MMNVVCVQPGKSGRNIIKQLGKVLSPEWALVSNPNGEPTRRMFVYSFYSDKFNVADVPVSKIRIIDTVVADAISLSDLETGKSILRHVLTDDVYKYPV